MYLVEPVTLSADYNASTNLGQKYYKADGYQVLTAKAGDVVYQETMVDSNLNKVLAESASPGLSYLFTKGLNAQGDAVIYFKRPSDYTPDFMERANWASAPEYSYAKTGDVFTLTGMYSDHNPLTINLPDGEFVTKYTLDLGPYGGDADATAETARIYDGAARASRSPTCRCWAVPTSTRARTTSCTTRPAPTWPVSPNESIRTISTTPCPPPRCSSSVSSLRTPG